MITEQDVRRKGTSILLGIAVENAVLDVLTNERLLQECLKLLDEPYRGLVYTNIGTFGNFPVTMSLGNDDSAIIMIDGPEFEQPREQCSAIYVGKNASSHKSVG
jgi:hypothetical protein